MILFMYFLLCISLYNAYFFAPVLDAESLSNFKILVGDSAGPDAGEECGHHLFGTGRELSMDCKDIDVGRHVTIVKYGPGWSYLQNSRYINLLSFCEMQVYGSAKGKGEFSWLS